MDMIRFITKYKFFHLLALPGIVYFLLFHYVPIYGIIIAFKDYNGFGGLQGIHDSPWIGFQNFINFFQSSYFWRLLSNTFLISFYQLIFGFPAPIILALLLNEVRNHKFKRVVQTITYMPHFLSWVVIAGLMTLLLSSDGVMNHLLSLLHLPQIDFLTSTTFFRSILVGSSIWHGIGWGTIVYLAAIVNVPQDLYEAAIVEGANRWQKAIYITLPSIMFVIVILFILEMGRIIDGNFEQILNLYNPAVYSVADTFDTFVYRRGIVQGDFSYSAAVGLFKSVTSFILVILANRLAKMAGQEGIW
ncbi:ABC transporter permease subunit [Paenibacillus sp. TRM 82003]|nr:ABC transporter permease subunit [Paenibacillus sp. TRM 82003]